MSAPVLRLPSYRHARSRMATAEKRRAIWRTDINGAEQLVGFARTGEDADRQIRDMKAADRRRLEDAARQAAAIIGERIEDE